MHLVHAALRTAAWLLALGWFWKLVEAARGMRKVPNLLAARYDDAPVSGESIVAIVPARNEAATVGAAIGSLLGQDYEGMRVIGVDDRSSDQTGAILDALGGAGGQFEAMHITDLPAGWLGKTHAMAVAARHAIANYDPDWLLFTDGDVIFQRDAIRRALAEASASRADHFVALPTMLAKTWGEAMQLAYLQVTGLWAVRLWRVADPKAKRDVVGIGAFNLIRTAAYEQLGGFDAIAMEIVEDMALARRVKRAGLRQRVAIAPGMVCVHWAAGLRGIVRGNTKNTFAFFRFRPGLLVVGAAGMAALCLGPVALLAVAGARLPAALALASIAGVYTVSSQSSRISPWYAVLFPLAALAAIYSMVRSMLVTLRDGGVTWRGTFYALEDLRRQNGADGLNGTSTK